MSNDLIERLKVAARRLALVPVAQQIVNVVREATDRLETELVNVNDLRLQIADLETANQQLHHDLTASREIVALLQQDR